jgi:hypothetical protein
MNNIRKIIEERLDNARNDYSDCFEKLDTPMFISDMLAGKIEAYQDCLNLMQPRTEQDILNDFEKLGYEVIVEKDHIRMSGYEDVCIYVDFIDKTYSKNKYLQAEDFTMQEHKLLNELFEVIFNDK